MAEHELPKLDTAVRFRSPALSLGREVGLGARSLRREPLPGSLLSTPLSGKSDRTPWGTLHVSPKARLYESPPSPSGRGEGNRTAVKLNPYPFILTAVLMGCTAYVEPPQMSQASGAFYHVVARGETLWRIARRYGVTMEELVGANQLSDASRIHVGQRVVIPAQGRPVPADSNVGRPEGFVWPVEGKVISVFGMRLAGRVNKGIDIQAPPGTEIVASASGRVSFIHENLPGFGKTIILDHGEGFATVYSYAQEILVRPGDQVHQRQVIAQVGASGRLRTGALHFEVRRNQKPQNPFHYLP